MGAQSGQLYFIALNALNERMEIQYVPDELNVTRQPDIEEIKIIGRNNPKHHYSGGTTKLQLKLDFCAQTENREDVIKKCRWLESLCYNDGYTVPPSKVKLVFGKLFRKEVWVVRNVSYQLTQFEKPTGWLPIQAYVTIDLSLDTKTSLRISDVR